MDTLLHSVYKTQFLVNYRCRCEKTTLLDKIWETFLGPTVREGFVNAQTIFCFQVKHKKKHQSFSLLKLTPVGVKIFSNSLKPRVLKFQYMGKLTSGSLFQRFLVPCPGDSNPEGQGWSRVVARQIGTTGPRTRPGKPCLRGQGQSCLPTEDHGQRGGASDFSFDF